MDTDAWIASAAVAVGLLGLAGGFLRWGMPSVLRFVRTLNKGLLELTGTPPEYDRARNKIKEGTPSLSAQIGDLKVIVADQGQQNSRISALELSHADLERRVTNVEAGHQLERITSNVAQGKVVDAIAEANRRRGVMDVDPEPGDEADTEL